MLLLNAEKMAKLYKESAKSTEEMSKTLVKVFFGKPFVEKQQRTKTSGTIRVKVEDKKSQQVRVHHICLEQIAHS
jgi:hypothetical protein